MPFDCSLFISALRLATKLVNSASLKKLSLVCYHARTYCIIPQKCFAGRLSIVSDSRSADCSRCLVSSEPSLSRNSASEWFACCRYCKNLRVIFSGLMACLLWPITILLPLPSCSVLLCLSWRMMVLSCMLTSLSVRCLLW